MSSETSEDTPAVVPDYVFDQVITELRRAYPNEVDKNDLQARTGVGPGDLREAVSALIDRGDVQAGEKGFRWLDPAERSLGPVDPDGAFADPDVLEDEEEALERAAEAGVEGAGADDEDGDPAGVPGVMLVDGTETRYEAEVKLTIGYYPEREDGEAPDEAALREAGLLARVAAEAIMEQYPTLAVSADVTLHAFDSPRQVFP